MTKNLRAPPPPPHKRKKKTPKKKKKKKNTPPPPPTKKKYFTKTVERRSWSKVHNTGNLPVLFVLLMHDFFSFSD
jgi:hypothetical protein